MQPLRRVVDTRLARILLAGALAAAAAGGLAGCAKFDAALGKQELVVAFKAGTPQATMMKVRSACSALPGATPEAVPTGANVTSGAYDVRYDISQASDADIARLEKCLSKFHPVQGINVEQEGGN